MRKFILAIIFVALVFAQNKNIHKELDAKKDRVNRLEEQEKSLTARLDNTLKKISQNKEQIKGLKNKLEVMDSKLDSLEGKIESTQKDLKKAINSQKDIVRNLYVSRNNPEIAIIYKDNFNDLPRKGAYLSSIANYRENAITETKMLVKELEKQKKEQKSLISQHEQALSKKKNNLKELQELTESQENILQNIRNEKSQYKDAIATLESQLKNIRGLSHSETRVQGQFSSRLPWPIKSREIIHGFGMTSETKFDTEFYNPGIDIRAKPNEQVRAVENGVVAHVGWLRGYGNIIILKHAQNYYTLYGNLESSTIDKGERVPRGMIIGDVSPYGWLEGAKLHFEIRQGKKELDPMKWLSESVNFS
ncbi:MAG: murein hydrolase activator EnvC family protein [Candidatus Zixiibacteriota bacterium]